MAEAECKAARMDSSPTLTVGLLSGAQIWGPAKVEAGTTASQLTERLSRPMGCPSVELVFGEDVLTPGADVSAFPDGSRLTAHYKQPKPFDHSFVGELCDLEGVQAELPLLVPTRMKNEAVKVPGAEVVLFEITAVLGYGQTLLGRLRLQVSENSKLLAKNPMDLTDAVLMFPEGGPSLKGGQWSVVEARNGHKLVELEVKTECECEESWGDLSEWTPVHKLVEQHLAKRVYEGVSCSLHGVPATSAQRLNELIDGVKVNEPADYHPGSNDVVRDLVHPSLYPYIKDVSAIAPNLPPDEARVLEEAKAPAAGKKRKKKAPAAVKADMWSRPYEASKYQWLPAEVAVSESGKCEFQTYINNLPKEKYGELYAELGGLLSKCLPYLEAAWSHGSAIKFVSENDEGFFDMVEEVEVPEKSLKARNLQVIVKIVDFELKPGQTHEGVWHVEGMSHENIVATAELVLQKGPGLVGGELEFQRAWTLFEAERLSGLPQSRPLAVDACIQKGLVPLGRLPLELGQLTAWSNSHVHKLSPLTNKGAEPEQRRIVVFWLVNPERRIVSTRHVPPQQGTISLEAAKAHRVNLMEERKRHKQDWNVREVSLCEH